MTPTTINQADTAWMLVATALVLVMTPALGFFYGGLVRAKNTLNTMMMSYVALGFVGIAWAFVGYTFAFSTGSNWLGGLDNAFFRGVGLDAKGSIPHILFAAYQATFCVITAALISGAIVERMRFAPYAAFITLWSIVVYAPIAHWVWGGGWLGKLGALDFAGGTVVHINAAAAALVVAVVLGARKDYARQAIIPQNVPFTLLGAGLLWFGSDGHTGRLELAGHHAHQEDDGGGSCHRHRRRSRRHHSRGGFCEPGIGNRAWRIRSGSELFHHSLESPHQAR